MKTMADRVFRDMAGGTAVGLAWLGVETGLFNGLAEGGAQSAAALAERCGLVERYVEEWARGMVAAEYLEFNAENDTFSLPDEHAYLLASDGTDHYMGGLFGMQPAVMAVAPRVRDAFRDGGGVPFEDYPAECREAIDLMNRGNYEHRLTSYWLQALPDIVQKLEDGGRVLDVGCGRGQVVLAMAKAFPNSEIVGVDPDTASIEFARAAVAEAGLNGNARFVADTLDGVSESPGFDLVLACDSLHDLPDPVSVLRDVRKRLAADGVLLVIEPRLSDHLHENVHPIGAMFYGFSVFHCLTQSLAQDGAGMGACAGPTRTKALFHDAGFASVEELELKSPVNSFYAVRA